MNNRRHCVTLAVVLAIFAPGTFAQSDVQAPPPLTEEDLKRELNADNVQPLTGPRAANARTTEGVVTEFGDENGVYLLEVQPAYGASYYMLDGDGDGAPGQYRQNIEAENSIGKWKLGEW